MKPRVELSGLGHYCVCTIVSAKDLEKASKFLQTSIVVEQEKNKRWHLDLGRYHPFGLEGSMCFLDKDLDVEEIKIGWYPGRLRDAMITHYYLSRAISFDSDVSDSPALSGDFLEVMASQSSQGWCVGANFGNDIWDVIENPIFSDLLPQINADIRNWWQDDSGSEMLGQYTTVFNGREGLTLQVYQPTGNGLWIVGSRKIDGCYGYQFMDHNTDTSHQAFAHILSLCIILKHCRDFIAQNHYQAVK